MTPKLPERIQTQRLVMRVPTSADAERLQHATMESHHELKDWLPWAGQAQTLEEARDYCTRARQRWQADEALDLLLEHATTGEIIGGSGFPRLDWSVPKFEIGYWCHTRHVGRGYVSEAVYELTRCAFEQLHAARVELYIDNLNTRSFRVAESLGFALEGLLKSESRNNAGGLRDTRIYGASEFVTLKAPYLRS